VRGSSVASASPHTLQCHSIPQAAPACAKVDHGSGRGSGLAEGSFELSTEDPGMSNEFWSGSSPDDTSDCGGPTCLLGAACSPGGVIAWSFETGKLLCGERTCHRTFQTLWD